MFWAHKRAMERVYGENFDLDPNNWQIFWFGKRGMVWSELITVLGKLTYGWPFPDLSLIHLGGKDIDKQKTLNLIFQIQDTFRALKAAAPKTEIISSEIIPHLVWLNSDVCSVFEKISKKS